MIVYEEAAVFWDRADAGRRLGEGLAHHKSGEAVVFAIPRVVCP
jgi:predicted phosphoribosyltransferase